jgi:hypothetical protein
VRKIWIAGSLVVGAIGCASPAPSPPSSSASAAPPAPAPAPPAAPEPAPPPEAAPKEPARFLPSKDAAGSPFAGGDGTSADQAVIILADTEDEGIDLEHHWTFDHYGRFRKVRGGLAAADGRHFDVITVELADHTEKTIFFDITAFYGVLEKPAAPPPQ